MLEKIIKRGLESIGLFYSSYRGFVIANDIDELGTLKIRVPILHGSGKGTCKAYPKNVISGINDEGVPYGMNLMPRVGDMIWVEFEHGNPRFPMWSHAYPLEGRAMEEFPNHKHYGYKSPAGQVVSIDDEFEDGEGRTYIRSKHIELGDASNLEQAVRGETLKQKLDELIDQIKLITVPTPSGPSGTPVNATAFTQIATSLEEILSDVNKLE